MDIVKLMKSDIKDALELVWLVFQEFEAPEYPEEGVNTFRDFIRYESVLDKVGREELIFWGCFVNNKLAGVLAIRDRSHICLLFVKKEYHRQGIARKLFQNAAEYVRKCGLHKITVHSSPYAVEAYRCLGFTDCGGEQTANGIRFTPMEYTVK